MVLNPPSGLGARIPAAPITHRYGKQQPQSDEPPNKTLISGRRTRCRHSPDGGRAARFLRIRDNFYQRRASIPGYGSESTVGYGRNNPGDPSWTNTENSNRKAMSLDAEILRGVGERVAAIFQTAAARPGISSLANLETGDWAR